MEKLPTVDTSLSTSTTGILRQKIVVVGDVFVGKTSIVNCFIEAKFKDNYEVKG
jgi:GTPase SAR1 family protein